MRKLFEFIRSIYVVVLFVALEVAAISYYAHSTHYTQARLLARSNQVAGGVHGFFAGIRRYFSLGHENRLLLGRVAQLEERLAQYEEAETNARLDSYMQDIGESKYRFVTASVVANTVNRAQNLITLNRGHRDGIVEEMAVLSPDGAGISVTTFFSTCSILSPFFAETAGQSSAGMPITSSISSRTRSTSADGRSILLMTGTISRSLSTARYALAIVCASMPCVASTTSSAPSQALSARDTSYPKST